MPRVKVYSTRWCGYCMRAKALLQSRGIEYEEILLDDNPTFRQHIFELSGRTTVPLITVDD
jgi:glutaredoxin 3